MNNKFSINKLNIAQIFFLLFVASLFFPVRYVFPTKTAFQIGAYSDFTSVSLYLSDIFLFLTILFIIPPRGVGYRNLAYLLSLTSLIIWLILDLFWHFNSLSELNWWFFAKYLELIVAYGTTYYLFSKTNINALFIRVFIFFAGLESILALWQFAIQKSIGHGLGRLGEQVLSPTMQGVAKIVSSGTTLIRGYGTFPHPNLLSAFLVTAVFFSLYELIGSKNKKEQVVYSFALSINLLGLTVTFSRAAFLALAFGLIIFFGYLLWTMTSKNKKTILSSLAILGAGIVLCFLIFSPYLATRATVTDDSALERIFYARIGLKMIAQHSVFGVGIGDSVLHMQQYSPFKLWPWQIQPIHNYFLLAAAELGIPGAIILIFLFLSHLKSLIINLKFRPKNLFALCLTSVLVGFLVLMQFDHYFYTLQQTQMLLWVILGIIAASIKNPQTGE